MPEKINEPQWIESTYNAKHKYKHIRCELLLPEYGECYKRYTDGQRGAVLKVPPAYLSEHTLNDGVCLCECLMGEIS